MVNRQTFWFDVNKFLFELCNILRRFLGVILVFFFTVIDISVDILMNIYYYSIGIDDFFFDNSNKFFLFILILPIFSIAFLILEKDKYWIRVFSFYYSLIIFWLSIILLISFDCENPLFQIFVEFYSFLPFNFSVVLGLDIFSVLFIVLSSFLCSISLLSSWVNISDFRFFALLLFFTEFCLFLVFSVLNLFVFFVLFEFIIIPMFLIIGMWGGRVQRIYAAFLFFYYTFFGSMLMLFAIIYLFITIGSLDFVDLILYKFTRLEEFVLFILFFTGFAVKIPLYPFHLWLPEAHVEAPTVGSVLLAGIMLKLGGYGLVRWCISLFPIGAEYCSDLVFTICVISILYSSFSALQQLDIKRLIAYSSIAHMSFAVLGFFSHSPIGVSGGTFLLISHGIISTGLFLAVGVLYDRYSSRSILYYGGLITFMPIFDTVLFILCMSNMAFPLTAGFAAEFLVLISIFDKSPILFMFVLFGVFFSGVYNIWMYCRIMLGTNIFKSLFVRSFSDLTFRESVVFFIVLFLNFFLGLIPNILIHFICSWSFFFAQSCS